MSTITRKDAVDAVFEALHKRGVWSAFVEQNPRGFWWKNAGPAALQHVISEIQIRLTPFGVLVCLDEDHRDTGLPKNIIVIHDDKTALIPLRFREKLAYVDGKPVATLHDNGALAFALAVVDAIERAVKRD